MPSSLWPSRASATMSVGGILSAEAERSAPVIARGRAGSGKGPYDFSQPEERPRVHARRSGSPNRHRPPSDLIVFPTVRVSNQVLGAYSTTAEGFVRRSAGEPLLRTVIPPPVLPGALKLIRAVGRLARHLSPLPVLSPSIGSPVARCGHQRSYAANAGSRLPQPA